MIECFFVLFIQHSVSWPPFRCRLEGALNFLEERLKFLKFCRAVNEIELSSHPPQSVILSVVNLVDSKYWHLNKSQKSQTPSDNMCNCGKLNISVFRHLKKYKSVDHNCGHQTWRKESPTNCPKEIWIKAEHELDVFAHSADAINITESGKLANSEDKRDKSCSIKIHKL